MNLLRPFARRLRFFEQQIGGSLPIQPHDWITLDHEKAPRIPGRRRHPILHTLA
jgi:hypothetical protein